MNEVFGFLGQSHGMELAFVVLAASAVFVFSLGMSAFILTVTDPARRRLAQVGTRDVRPKGGAESLAERLRPLAALMLPKGRERTRVSQLLVHAGFQSPYALSTFYGVKAVLIGSLPLAVFAASPFFPKARTGTIILAAVAAAFFASVLQNMWLERRVEKRQRSLRNGFPDALDLLVVCVESGLGLAPALQRVADELSVSHPELAMELALVNAEMRAGVERTVALRNLAVRTGLADIRGLVALMVQTMRFGTGIADALRVYAEEFRDKRMQAAEEQAAKIGTKMIFPLVTCLFPSFFLVAVGPAILRLIDAFSVLRH